MRDNQADAAADVSCCSCRLNPSRRTLLRATAGVGLVAGVGAVSPFVASLFPDEAIPSAGGNVDCDLAGLAPGQMVTLAWQGRPVWVLHRTPAMLAALRLDDPRLLDPASVRAEQPDYVRGAGRAVRDEFFVCVGLCTHLGCAPAPRFEAGAGYFECPCHGARFDLAGRVFKGSVAQTNLAIPPHHFLGTTHLRLGAEMRPASA